MMADNKERRMCVQFCFLLGNSAAEIVLMLQEAFKEEALSKTQAYEWYSHFNRSEKSCEDQPRSDQTSTAEMMKILKMFATESMQIVVGPLMS